MDKTRPEAMYFMGIHYYLNNDKFKSYQYMKKAFEIGYPIHCQYSLKPTLSFHFIPKFLSELCYQFEDYETGEKCCELFLEKKIMGNEYLDAIKSWHDIFLILNKFNVKHMLQPKIPEKPYFCFLAEGGFNKWSGSTILKQGVGGSETYIIELSKYIQKSGKYNVIVFCKCEENETFEDVEYRSLTEFFDFVRENKVEHCIISRYSEYIPFSLKSHINNVYFVSHDLTPTGIVFPLENKFKKVFCLSEWHVQYFTEIFPQLKDITVPFYYGIDKELFDCEKTNKKLYKFIYSSFPNRGLLHLLQIWPRIINKYPSASLYIHCDVEGKWVNENATEHMKLVKELLYNMIKEKKYNIYYMGWTSKEKLAQSWKTADVWFYPCIFNETFCLTALEAAISKTLVVTNNLAALQNTVGDRGIVSPIEGDFFTDKWINEILNKMFYVLDNREKREFFVNKNYEWARNMTWENRANDLIDILKVYEKDNKIKYKNVDIELDYKDMYNWTNDLPENTILNYLNVIEYFNKKNIKNPKILEIGTYTGVSIIHLLKLINNSNSTVIDKWTSYNECHVTTNIEKNDIEKTFYKNIKNKNMENKIEILKGDSFEMLIKLIKQNKMFDFIYVDGSHKCLDCYNDMIISWELLNIGGILVIDVIYNKENGILESPFEAVLHFLKKYENKYKILNNEYRLFIEKI
jgi:hypothetical protein